MIFRNISNHICQKCWRQKPAIILFRKWRRMLTIRIFREISDYNFQKCWRRTLAITIFRNTSNEWQLLYFPEMLASNVNNYRIHKCWRQMLVIIIFRNVGKYNGSSFFLKYKQSYCLEMLATNDSISLLFSNIATSINNYIFQKCKQLQFSEMLATNVNNSFFQKCWR